MAKRQKKIDPNQLSFDFDQKIDEYISLKQEILSSPKIPRQVHSYEETCIEIAATIKRMIRRTGLSRDQVVDLINDHFGWKKGSSTTNPTSADYRQNDGYGKQRYLSIHMFNHFLSKPTEYPIYAFYLFAIQRICESLKIAQMFADADGARVISGDEVRQMTLGKLDETIMEMQKLKKELRRR